MSDGEDRKKQSPLTWVLGGCGGVLLLGVCLVCIGPSFFGMAMMGLDGLGGSTPVPVTMPAPVAYDAAALTGGPVLPDPTGPLRPPMAIVDPLTDLEPRRIHFDVTAATGARAPALGTTCVAEIRRIVDHAPDYVCDAYVFCGTTVLRENRHGFFMCQLLMNPRRDVTGNDPEGRELDGDGVLSIDTTINTISLTDTAGELGELTVAGTVTSID